MYKKDGDMPPLSTLSAVKNCSRPPIFVSAVVFMITKKSIKKYLIEYEPKK